MKMRKRRNSRPYSVYVQRAEREVRDAYARKGWRWVSLGERIAVDVNAILQASAAYRTMADLIVRALTGVAKRN